MASSLCGVWEFTSLTTLHHLALLFLQNPILLAFLLAVDGADPAGCWCCLEGSHQGFFRGFSTPLTFLSPGCERKTSHQHHCAWQNPYTCWGKIKPQLSLLLPSGEENPQWRFCFVDAVCEQFIYLFMQKVIGVNPLSFSPHSHWNTRIPSSLRHYLLLLTVQDGSQGVGFAEFLYRGSIMQTLCAWRIFITEH